MFSRRLSFPGRVFFSITIFGVVIIVYKLALLSNSTETNLTSYWSKQTNQESDTNYVVDTPGCKLLGLDPFDGTVKKFFGEATPTRCKPAFSYVRNEMLYVDKEVTDMWTIDNLNCCYRSFHRVNQNSTDYNEDADWNIEFSEQCTNIEPGGDPVGIYDQFIQVECHGDGKMDGSRDYHAIPLTPSELSDETNRKAEYWNKRKITGEVNPPNILVIGVDSVSRLNFIRSMPKTREFLLKNDFIEMEGYMKVGDNTFPNIMAGFGGMEVGNYPCWPNASVSFDDCPFIWKEFNRLNYLTAMIEDSPEMAAFNYLKTGFVLQPFDYYLRPFMVALTQEKTPCPAGLPISVFTLKYLKEFVKVMGKEFPYFVWVWMNAETHDNVNALQTLDDMFLDFFVNVFQNTTGNPDNTIVLFMSDHGMRFLDFRETFQGYYEVSLPLLSIRLPPRVKQRHPEWYQNLVQNRNKMTTPLDLHSALNEVVNDVNVKLRKPNIYSTQRYSLFDKIPGNRTCESASIPADYCMCDVTNIIHTDVRFTYHLGNIVVNEINKLLQEGTKPGLCSNLTLSNVVYAREVGRSRLTDKLGNMINYTDHLIAIEVLQSGAKFESKLREIGNSSSYSIIGQIERINMYGDQSQCVENEKMRLYCLCVD